MLLLLRVWGRISSIARKFVWNCVQKSFSLSQRDVSVIWTNSLKSFNEFYEKFDETSCDVTGIDEKSFPWASAHITNRYGTGRVASRHLSYQCQQDGDSIRFVSIEGHGHWVYLVSKCILPSIYAIEFDYTPKTEFHEQLQFCFDTTSLADRHRFVVEFNRSVYYQIISHAYWFPILSRVPFSFDIGKKARVRLEVVNGNYTLLVNNDVIISVKDQSVKERQSRGMLIFWNGGPKDGSPLMDFQIDQFRFFIGRAK